MKKMKKMLTAALCALMVLSGCAGGGSGSEGSQGSSREEAETLLKQAEERIDQRGSYLRTTQSEGTTLQVDESGSSLRVVESDISGVAYEYEVFLEEEGKVIYNYKRETELKNGGIFIPYIGVQDREKKTIEQANLFQGEDGKYDEVRNDESNYGSFSDDSMQYNDLQGYTSDYWKYKDCFDIALKKEGDDNIITITCSDLDAFTEEILSQAEVDVYMQSGVRVSDNRYTQVEITITLDSNADVKSVHTSFGHDYGDGLTTNSETEITFSALSDPTYSLEELKAMMEKVRS